MTILIPLALAAVLHICIIEGMENFKVGDPFHGKHPPNGVFDPQGSLLLQSEAKPAEAGKGGKAGKASKVGTTKSWPAADETMGAMYMKDFELRKVGKHLEIWVATDRAFPDPNDIRNVLGLTSVTDSQLKFFADEFDEVIYPALSGTPRKPGALSIPPFMDGTKGSTPGFLGHGDRIVVLADNIRDANFYNASLEEKYTAGFVSPSFLELTGRHVFVVDVFDWLHYLRMYEAVFAHEYCHLLSYYFGLKDDWLEEGIADWAMRRVGYHDTTLDPEDPQFPSHLKFFHGYGNEIFGGPEQSLTEWIDQGNPELLADYGAAYSFLLFLEARFGSNFIPDLHNDPSAYSVSSFQSFLNTRSEVVLFEDLLQDWQVALVTYGELSGRVRTFVSSTFTSEHVAFSTVPRSRINWDTPQAYDSPGAPTNGGDFVLLNGAGALSHGDIVAFKGGSYMLDKWVQELSPTQILFSKADNNLRTAIVREIDLRSGREIKLSIAYDIEEDFDFFIVLLFDVSTKEWVSIPGDQTVDQGMSFNEYLPGLTGASPGFPAPVELVYTAPPQFGGLDQVNIALLYLTDEYIMNPGIALHGMTVNSVPIANANDITTWGTFVDAVNKWSVTIVAYNIGGSDGVFAEKVPLTADGESTLLAGVNFPIDKSIVGMIIGAIDTTGRNTGNVLYNLTVNGNPVGKWI